MSAILAAFYLSSTARRARQGSASPSSARDAEPTPGPLGDFPEIQPAVIAPAEGEEGEAVEGSVVADPTKTALHLLRETFTPFVIFRAHSTVFVVHIRIGEGMSSAVYQVEDRVRGKPFALKVVPLVGPYPGVAQGTAELLRRLRHRHIIHCYSHFQYTTQTVPFLCLKLEPCLRGTLADLLRRSDGPISGSHVALYMTQLASALQYLHQQGILHGDVRADHVLLATHDEEVRLTGLTHSLGLRRRAPGQRLTVTGGHGLFAPPEWAESGFQGRALHPTEVPLPSYDMWGLGCLLVELCTNNLLEDRLGLNSDPLAADAVALEAVQQELEAVHRGAFAPLGFGLLDCDPDTRLTAEAAQTVLEAASAKVGFWSRVIATPRKVLKLSRQA
eukprot:EG_transcript_6006